MSNHLTLDVDLDRLLAYEAWANRASLDSLASVGTEPEQALRIMAHIIGASRLWLARLHAAPSSIAVWPTFSLDRMRGELDTLRLAWQEWRESSDALALNRPVDYLNSKGESWHNTVREILTHLVLHSSYHRGQIAMLIGRGGGKAASTDYIHAVREKLI